MIDIVQIYSNKNRHSYFSGDDMIWKYNVDDRIIDYKEDGSLKRDVNILEQRLINNKKWYKYNFL